MPEELFAVVFHKSQNSQKFLNIRRTVVEIALSSCFHDFHWQNLQGVANDGNMQKF